MSAPPGRGPARSSAGTGGDSRPTRGVVARSCSSAAPPPSAAQHAPDVGAVRAVGEPPAHLSSGTLKSSATEALPPAHRREAPGGVGAVADVGGRDPVTHLARFLLVPEER